MQLIKAYTQICHSAHFYGFLLYFHDVISKSSKGLVGVLEILQMAIVLTILNSNRKTIKGVLLVIKVAFIKYTIVPF